MTIAPAAADVSEHNHIYTDQYGRRFIIFRATFGAHYLDHNFLHNANQAAKDYKAGLIDGAACYLVWLQSATPAEHYKFFWQQFGGVVPPWLMAVMTDIERWGGTSYQNGGDHSKALNTLNAMNAHKMGSWPAAWWYGNAGDINSLYPHRDSRFMGIEARYSNRIGLTLKGAIGQQYTDGQAKWGVPSGYPISSAPFGHVDHNAFPGVKSFKELRAKVRPAITPPKPTPPPTPKPPVDTLYAKPVGTAAVLVSPDRHTAYYPTNDGRIEVRSHHKHVRYL